MAAAAHVDRSRPNSLFYLPDELLIQVVSHLANDTQTLCSLARVSRFFQIEAEKHIYTKIELLDTADLHAIIDAFTRRFDRVASVETLKIVYRFHDGLGATADERAVFNARVGGMKDLRSWEIESPYDNYKWDEGGDEWVLKDMEDFRTHLEAASLKAAAGSLSAPGGVGLSKLERLVIHTHGVSDDFWNLGEFHCLFRHPSLRYLHVSCLALPSDLPELEPYAKSTPLTELVFDECELEPRSLGRILATPKALTHLTLGENVYNINEGRGANPRLTRAPEAALAALSHVAHSLVTLTHYNPVTRRIVDNYKVLAIPGAGMRHFHSLKTLRVDVSSFLHRGIALSHVQAPPNLHTLQIRNPRQKFSRWENLTGTNDENFFEELPPHDPYTYLASLKTLEFVQGATSEMYITKSPESLRERHKTGYKLFKHGINLKVTLEGTLKTTLIPPFLYGEPQPELLCIYDAQEIGFRREWAPANEAELRAQEAEYAQTSAWLRGDDTSEPENDEDRSVVPPKAEEQTEFPETDQLTDSDIIWCRNRVGRSLNALWGRMRRVDTDEEPHVFTVTIDSDEEDDMWDDVLDEDDEDLAEWMDAEEGDIEYVLAEELLGPDGEGDEMFWEAQAQALLAAAADAVAAEDEDEDDNELTEHDMDDGLD